MKQQFLFFLTMYTTLIYTPAIAITKCFKDVPYRVDDSYTDSAHNSYWGVAMGDTIVEGVALCGEISGKPSDNNATLCHCIATTPFISDWFTPDGYYDDQGEWQYTQGRFETISDCEDQCAYYCSQTYNIYEYGDRAPRPADGTSNTECPSGFLAISYDNLTLATSSCTSGTNIGTITACQDIGTDDQECGLFIPAGTYKDASGTYTYSEPCPWTD